MLAGAGGGRFVNERPAETFLDRHRAADDPTAYSPCMFCLYLSSVPSKPNAIAAMPDKTAAQTFSILEMLAKICTPRSDSPGDAANCEADLADNHQNIAEVTEVTAPIGRKINFIISKNIVPSAPFTQMAN
jgi:hypothetical protein